ncbi:MAG TPA: Holliday junction branch migration protein RuvA [Paracoccaceae bacterium]|nr:Holliday junction branch migration protein RuvA [Paracoccaceae bacterium]
MIGRISGRVDYVAEDHALIEAAGVGYVVFAAPRTLARLPSPGEPAALYTELVVREDLLQLFGFETPAEREWHRLLTSVQGVGAKVALAILGALGPDGVSRAVAMGDSTAIRAAPGVGPKIAQRIANELRDKAPGVMALGARGARRAAPGSAAAGPEPAARPAAEPSSEARDPQAEADALSALANLGYAPADAARAVAEAAAETPGADAAALIRAALRALAPAER